MEQVFYCDDLRREIFSYLRSFPHKKCQICNLVLEWDKNIKKNDYIEYYTILNCYDCYRYNFLKHYQCYMC